MIVRQGVKTKRYKSFATLLPSVNPAASRNQNPKTTWSALGHPYLNLLQPAGATEDQFAGGPPRA